MDDKTKKEVEAIIGEMECSKDFECYKSGFENLCNAKDIGIKKFWNAWKKQPYPDDC